VQKKLICRNDLKSVRKFSVDWRDLGQRLKLPLLPVYWPPLMLHGVYNFEGLCMYVCMCLSADNFWKPWCTKFIFAHPVYLRRLWVKFVYEGHRVKVTVTRADKRLLLSCHPYASVTAWIQPRWPADCVIQGRHVSTTMGNSVCPAYHIHAFLGGWP